MADFNFIIPLSKGLNNSLSGVASTTSVDRDEERMSAEALKMMVDDIKKQGVNLFGNHEHNWENTLGIIKDASLVNNQVAVKIDLDDPQTNQKIPMLLNKLGRGIKLGLSVGGNVLNYKWEYDRELGKKIKVLDKVKIYEVSVVGIPSNADSFLTIPQAIAKSARINKEYAVCPKCHRSDKTEEVESSANPMVENQRYCSRCRLNFDWEKSAKIFKEQLPIYQIRGKRYYRDARLGEYRNVNDFEDTIPIDDVDLEDLEKPTRKCFNCFAMILKGVERCSLCLTRI